MSPTLPPPRVRWVIWAALTGSILLYFLLVRSGSLGAAAPGTGGTAAAGASLALILTAIGVVNALASMAIRVVVKSVRDPQGRPVTPAWTFPAFMVALALAESAAVFGFILGQRGEDPKSMMLLFGIAFAAMLANNPASFFAKVGNDD